MATLYISEYSILPQMSGGQPMIAPEPSLTTQTVTPISSSAQSAAFNAQTHYIAICCDGIFSYAVGANPTATTAKMRVPADQILFMAVQPGDKIAAITNT
jgi:hypothetical protein